MKNLLKLLVTAAMLFGTHGVAQQPGTYTSPGYLCNADSRYPVSSWNSLFFCNTKTYDNNQIQLVFSGEPRFEFFGPDFTIGPYTSQLDLTEFTKPNGSTPGTLSFNWSGTDTNGVQHSGSVTGTWINIENWRGWWYPKFTQSTLIITQ